MNAKEFLQLTNQIELLMAFNSVMKGELAKETKQAKDALSELQEVTDLKKDKELLIQEKLKFSSYKEKTENFFEGYAKKLKEKEKLLSDKENSLHVRGVEMDAKESQFAATIAKTRQLKTDIENDIIKAQANLISIKQEIEKERAKLQKEINDVAIREQIVADKLAAIKAIA